jgi:hypothetical protein
METNEWTRMTMWMDLAPPAAFFPINGLIFTPRVASHRAYLNEIFFIVTDDGRRRRGFLRSSLLRRRHIVRSCASLRRAIDDL